MSTTLEDYLFTLGLCEKALPGHTNRVHFTRLEEIRRILQARDKARQQEK